VELVQIPSDSDFNDNIVAYWVPEEKAVPGKPIQISYKQRWFLDDVILPPTGQIRATTIHKTAQRTEMLIDFARGNLEKVPENALEASVQVGNGAKVLTKRLDKLADFWRLTLFIEKESQNPVEMRAYLKHKDKMDAVTETFSYALVD
jgi:glucans biosynthesis protein